MSDPFDESFTQQNPIVAAASLIRARREVERALQDWPEGVPFEDAEGAFAAFGELLQRGAKRVNAVLGERTGIKFVRIARPARLILRLGELRVSLDLDEIHQLVRIAGMDLDGEWQFNPDSAVPALINLSKISTEAGYGEALTPSSLLRRIARDFEPQ